MIDLSLFPILDKFESLSWRPSDPNLGQCKCPAHDDRTESLHVTLKEDELGNPKILLKCHAGCEVRSILQALGETFSSLFPDRTRSAKTGHRPFTPSSAVKKGPAAQSAHAPSADPKLVKVYSYLDAAGKVLHQTLRWEPKNFTQRRIAEPNKVYSFGKQELKSFKDPHGNWWINTLKGIEPIPYHLPEILAAPSSRIIFICEGEKDADNLRSAFGCTATTVPMGSGKWRPSYSEHFRGRRVAIIPDMDKPRKGQSDPMANAGVDGAKKIAAELVTIAAEVRIVYLPDLGLTPKWDLSDWLKAGGTQEQFGKALFAAEILTPNHPGLIPAGMSAADHERILSAIQSATTATTTATTTAATTLPAEEEGPNLPASVKYEFGRPVRQQLFNFLETSDQKEALGIRAIMQSFKNTLDGWPKRVGPNLFFVDHECDPQEPKHPIQWLNSTASLFGWASRYTGHPVAWAKGAGYPTKEETFAELQHSVENFESVDVIPHHPRVPEVYYACPGDDFWKSKRPGCLLELIARFSPAELRDYELMMAFFATLVWGGPGGQRPMFVITADSGRGAGKTTFATLATSIVGGSLDFNSNADQNIVLQRLLSPEGREKRCVVIDNVKTHKFSHAALEALITSSRISGRQMYTGEGSRDNRITYIATMNAPSFSRDLAQRSVVIKLGAPIHSGDWLADTAAFIHQNKQNLISEMMDLLKGPQLVTLTKSSRWGLWEREVLCRLAAAEDCQRLILKRQHDMDADRDESSLLVDFFRDQLQKNRQNPDTHRYYLTRATCAAWVNAALGTRHDTASACRILSQRITEGDIVEIEKSNGGELTGRPGDNTRERGFFWTPANWRGGKTQYLGDFETFNGEQASFGDEPF